MNDARIFPHPAHLTVPLSTKPWPQTVPRSPAGVTSPSTKISGSSGMNVGRPLTHWMAREPLTIHTHEALCSQETRRHRLLDRAFRPGRPPASYRRLSPTVG